MVRIAGKCMDLFRVVDTPGPGLDCYLSETRDRETAKRLLLKVLANSDHRPRQGFARNGLRSYPAAIRELPTECRLAGRCRQRTRRYCNPRIESEHCPLKRRLRAMQRPRTSATAWAVIQAVEAAQRIRKGQVLGLTRQNLHGQAWVFCEPSGAVRKSETVTLRHPVVPVADGFLGGFVRVHRLELRERNGHLAPLPANLHKHAVLAGA